MKSVNIRFLSMAVMAALVFCLTAYSNSEAAKPTDNGTKPDKISSCCVLPGDFNGDGVVDPMDIEGLTNWLWNKGPAPKCLSEMDVDCSCEVDGMDLVYLVDFMWSGGPAPCNSCAEECWGGSGSCCVLRGDFNHDGEVNEQDYIDWISWLNCIFEPCFGPVCMEEANVDGIGDVNVMDFLYFQSYILDGGPPPVPCDY